MSTTRLDFGKLPLVEAAVRASFNSPAPLTYTVVNAIADQLKPSFPVLSEPQQIEIAPGVGPSPTEFGPTHLPGAVYMEPSSGLTVSIHPQVVVARWAKQYVSKETTYPRFPALRDALWSAVEAFRTGAGEEFPSLSVMNMSYTNFLPDSEGPVTAYLAEQARLGTMAKARRVHKLEAAWSEQEGLDVRFAVEQVNAKVGSRIEKGHRLTTAAGIRLMESLDAKTALERVHDTLQLFFLKLISEHARKVWSLTEVPCA